jgi:hypothetical protein
MGPGYFLFPGDVGRSPPLQHHATIVPEFRAYCCFKPAEMVVEDNLVKQIIAVARYFLVWII